MATTEQLALAHRGFADLAARVEATDWVTPTPCVGWDVDELVWHLVVGERAAVVMLDGGSPDDVQAAFGWDHAGLDARSELAQACTASLAAFGRPGAFETVVHHPMGEVPGSMLIDFRVGDFTLHTWDLARAIGADEALDPSLVELVWGQLSPLSAILGSFGIFGEGPSGSVPDDAPLQARLLDLSGRRP